MDLGGAGAGAGAGQILGFFDMLVPIWDKMKPRVFPFLIGYTCRDYNNKPFGPPLSD